MAVFISAREASISLMEAFIFFFALSRSPMLLSISATLWMPAICFFVSEERLLLADAGIISSMDIPCGIVPLARLSRVDWMLFIWVMADFRPSAAGVL